MTGKIVLGTGFGDEGKGLTTSYLVSQVNNPMVVRFNGGHQAGHTVWDDVNQETTSHVFSGFGSGTLQGAPTYWSQFCTFYPPSFLREHELLVKKGVTPKIYVHPLCPVTTPWDIDYNRAQADKNLHGSVGMGFGTTIARQEAHYKLHVMDLYFTDVLNEKIKAILKFYGLNVSDPLIAAEVVDFSNKCYAASQKIDVDGTIMGEDYDFIFEGAQGIMLDMDHGFFPHVTRSNTTSKNALELYRGDKSKLEVYYVTRTYLTRHGAGPLPGEAKLELTNNENETNKRHPWQGEFRTAPFNYDLFMYALAWDSFYHQEYLLPINLMITCMDQYPLDVTNLVSEIPFKLKQVLISQGPHREAVRVYPTTI